MNNLQYILSTLLLLLLIHSCTIRNSEVVTVPQRHTTDVINAPNQNSDVSITAQDSLFQKHKPKADSLMLLYFDSTLFNDHIELNMIESGLDQRDLKFCISELDSISLRDLEDFGPRIYYRYDLILKGLDSIKIVLGTIIYDRAGQIRIRGDGGFSFIPQSDSESLNLISQKKGFVSADTIWNNISTLWSIKRVFPIFELAGHEIDNNDQNYSLLLHVLKPKTKKKEMTICSEELWMDLFSGKIYAHNKVSFNYNRKERRIKYK